MPTTVPLVILLFTVGTKEKKMTQIWFNLNYFLIRKKVCRIMWNERGNTPGCSAIVKLNVVGMEEPLELTAVTSRW